VSLNTAPAAPTAPATFNQSINQFFNPEMSIHTSRQDKN